MPIYLLCNRMRWTDKCNLGSLIWMSWLSETVNKNVEKFWVEGTDFLFREYAILSLEYWSWNFVLWRCLHSYFYLITKIENCRKIIDFFSDNNQSNFCSKSIQCEFVRTIFLFLIFRLNLNQFWTLFWIIFEWQWVRRFLWSKNFLNYLSRD